MNLMIWDASGRIRVGKEEFHGNLEIDGPVTDFGADQFFRFRLRLALSDAELSYLRGCFDQEAVTLHLLGATVRTTVNDHQYPSEPINAMIRFPPSVIFDSKTGYSRPPFLEQAGTFSHPVFFGMG